MKHIEVEIHPAGALRALHAYKESNYACDLAMTASTTASVCELQVMQDGSDEPARIVLRADGTWVMIAALPIDDGND
jgi:hypothetical protein